MVSLQISRNDAALFERSGWAGWSTSLSESANSPAAPSDFTFLSKFLGMASPVPSVDLPETMASCAVVIAWSTSVGRPSGFNRARPKRSQPSDSRDLRCDRDLSRGARRGVHDRGLPVMVGDAALHLPWPLTALGAVAAQ